MGGLVLSEDKVLPGGNSEDPGIFFLVYSDNGVNSTADVTRFSVGLKSLVKDHEAQQRITKEEELILLEDDGHDRWHLLISGTCRGLGGKQPSHI